MKTKILQNSEYRIHNLIPPSLKLKLPLEWEVVSLKELIVEHKAGIFKNQKFYGRGVNIVGVADLYYNSSINGQIFRLVELNENERKEYQLKNNDIVYSESSLVKEGIGKALCVTKKGEGTIFAWHTRRIRLNQNANSKYIYYILDFEPIRKSIINRSTTTALTGIPMNEYFKTKIPLPPLKEQQKIESILSNIDELIQKTEQIIEQTQRFKKGLINNLLTKGVGHTKFKKSQIGIIAEEIQLKKLEDYIDIISGEYFAYSEFSNDGIPVLKIDNVVYGEIDWTTKTYLSKEYLNSHQHLILKEGDIVLALNRPITNNQVKVGVLKKEDSPSILYQRVGKFELKSEELRRDFFMIYLSSEIFKKLLSKVLIGSDQPYVKTTELKRQKVAFPEIKEQQKIASIVIPIIKDIEIKQKYKKNLESLKKGLMQQLLTGKTRVKV